MNKVITVNLGGLAFQIEENGYEHLRAYLDQASARLAKNPDRAEIIADIEQAIADKFRGVLRPHKNVVTSAEVERVLSEMGPVQDEGASESADSGAQANAGASMPRAASSSSNASGASQNGPAKRLYRIPEGAMIGGVCNGIAVYFGIDVVLVRLVAIGLGLLFGLIALGLHWVFIFPVLAYAALVAVLPEARTPEEVAAARGDPSTAQEYIRRAQEGYYASLRSLRQVRHQNWKRHFESWRYGCAPNAWAPNPVVNTASATTSRIVLPILELIKVIVSLIGVWVVLRLLTQGSVLGFTPPNNIPLWVTLVAVIFVFKVILLPLKAARYACWGALIGRPVPWEPGVFGALFSFAALVFGIWSLDHYFPPFHQFLLDLPENARRVSAALDDWWHHLRPGT